MINKSSVTRIMYLVIPSLVGVGIGILIFDGVHENMATWKAAILATYLGLFISHTIRTLARGIDNEY